MIFAHIIAGLLPVENFNFSWFWFAGSLTPDLDHIFFIVKYKFFSYKKIAELFCNEEKYSLRLRTKYVHSLLGAVIISLPIFLYNTIGGTYFFAGYIFHLLLDWPDKDIKQYLYPLKKEFKGFLPIFSKPEKLFTLAILLIIIFIYIWKKI